MTELILLAVGFFGGLAVGWAMPIAARPVTQTMNTTTRRMTMNQQQCSECPTDPKALAARHNTEDYLVVRGTGHFRMNKFDENRGRATAIAVRFWHALALAEKGLHD